MSLQVNVVYVSEAALPPHGEHAPSLLQLQIIPHEQLKLFILWLTRSADSVR
jgi:hypothetical protein